MTPNHRQMLDPDHGIDDRITVQHRPFALAHGWDWTVTIGDAARRFPDEHAARQYAREATRILHNNDKAARA